MIQVRLWSGTVLVGLGALAPAMAMHHARWIGDCLRNAADRIQDERALSLAGRGSVVRRPRGYRQTVAHSLISPPSGSDIDTRSTWPSIPSQARIRNRTHTKDTPFARCDVSRQRQTDAKESPRPPRADSSAPGHQRQKRRWKPSVRAESDGAGLWYRRVKQLATDTPEGSRQNPDTRSAGQPFLSKNPSNHSRHRLPDAPESETESPLDTSQKFPCTESA